MMATRIPLTTGFVAINWNRWTVSHPAKLRIWVRFDRSDHEKMAARLPRDSETVFPDAQQSHQSRSRTPESWNVLLGISCLPNAGLLSYPIGGRFRSAPPSFQPRRSSHPPIQPRSFRSRNGHAPS